MSGIACIYNLDGRRVERRLLERMNASIAHRGSDAVGLWHDGPIGMTSRMFWTTPESVGEVQPLQDPHGAHHLLIDGRIDSGPPVLDAYDKWGDDCPVHLIGDFALILWDAPNQRLICARDILGVRPLYYYSDAKTFIAASEPQALLEHPDVPREPNEGMIGEFLAEAPTNLEETVWRGIRRLPPAHTLTIGLEGIRVQRYWSVDPSKEIRYLHDEDYVEHFREIFAEAVRCRLRSHGRVGSDLSGGLDSSSVVCMASKIQHIETFSLVFPGRDSCDERSYIDAVVEKSGATPNFLEPDGRELGWAWDQVKRYQDIPDYPNGAMHYGLYTLAQGKGFRVMLGGDGGDQWMDGSYYHAADLLRKGRLLSMWRRVRHDSARWTLRGYAGHMRRYAIRPLLEPGARLWGHAVPDYIVPDFARRICLKDRLQGRAVGREFQRISKRDTSEVLLNGWNVHVFETTERATTALGIETRQPLNDRRVIEFAMAIPEEQRVRGKWRRFLQRSAMRGILPEVVRQRRSKARFSHIFEEAFEGLGSLLDGALQCEDRGWVNGEKVRQLDGWNRWMVAGMEMWLKERGHYGAEIFDGRHYERAGKQ